jgi:hypothetical protein
MKTTCEQNVVKTDPGWFVAYVYSGEEDNSPPGFTLETTIAWALRGCPGEYLAGVVAGVAGAAINKARARLEWTECTPIADSLLLTWMRHRLALYHGLGMENAMRSRVSPIKRAA